ncbi:LysE family translocator [Microbacterium invictum]|uniref:Threonine/homoserine/homoserine lactone efflux protein n=1 Tax=Microbacterium invictum TaxID=515415 RepID=A0AA40SM25_9MICO|nr:LysE family translocator [Microbacterium invictum]MBB4138725.1 threonine/homoserine/homoserine lactone efflux protein [Microbacterium invictum]
MEAGLVVAFWGVSMLFVVTPGVDWAYAIASGTKHRTGVLPAVSGMLAGHLAATLVVAAGVAALLAASGVAMTVLTVAGAVYLVWLGVGALRHHAAPDLAGEPGVAGNGTLFAKGIGISVLNPKVFLLFLALLPQFASERAGWSVGAQMAMLGGVHVANCAIVYFAVGYGAAAVLTTRPKAAKIVGIVSGVVMIGLGIALVAEKVLSSIH